MNQKIYHVHAFPDTGQSYVEEYRFVAFATMQGINVPSMLVSTSEGMIREVSLRDCNIIPNVYNSHRIFSFREAAEQYCANSSLWRPLGFSEQQWEEYAREEYLEDKRTNEFWSSHEQI